MKQALYGLGQSPRAWYHRIDVALLNRCLERSQADPNLYLLQNQGDILLLILYVDNLYVKGSHPQLIDDLALALMKEFAMTNQGTISKYLGVSFVHTLGGLLLHQDPYALFILAVFSFDDCRPSFIPLNEGLQLRRNTGTLAVDTTIYKRLVRKLLYHSYHYLKRYPSFCIFYENGEQSKL